MILLTLVTAGEVFASTTNDLSKFVLEFHRSTKQNVVIAPLGKAVPSIRISFENLASLNKAVSKQLGCDLLQNPEIAGFGFRTAPSFLFNPDASFTQYLSAFPIAKENTLKKTVEGWILTPVKDQYFRIGDLPKEKFSVPLRVHWLFQDLRFIGATSNMREAALLNLIAQSVAGRIEESKFALDVILDGAAFKRRWIAMLEQKRMNAENKILRASYDFGIEALSQLSSTVIERLFEKKNNRLLVALPAGSKAEQRANTLLSTVADSANSDAGMAALLKRINPLIPPKIALQTNGSVAASFQGEKESDRIEF